jgi:hypothetical protein
MNKSTSIEKLIAKQRKTKDDWVRLLELQSQVILAFRLYGRQIEPEDSIKAIEEVLNTDSMFASHVVAMDLLIRK